MNEFINLKLSAVVMGRLETLSKATHMNPRLVAEKLMKTKTLFQNMINISFYLSLSAS